MKTLLLLFILTTALFSMNNFNKGVKAYKEGEHKMAISYWMPYAIDNDSNAQYLIGNIYYDGKEDVGQDYKKAMEWYEKASAAGSAKAQLKIALMYCEGDGVLISYKKAIPYVQKAYNNGYEVASEVWTKYKLYDYE